MPKKKKPISDLYRDLIAPQIQNNEEDVESLLELNEDDSDIQGIIDLLADVEEETITITEDNKVINNDAFYSNLVDVLPVEVMDDLYVDLDDDVQQDRSARMPKIKRYAQFLKRLNFTHQDKIGGASFQGASTVGHNAAAVAVVDFTSRAIKEIAPVNGCTKSKIIGNATNERIKLGNKLAKFYNYVLTEWVPYRDILEILFSQVCISGSAYLKWSYDKRRKMPIAEFVPIDYLYLPIYTQDFYTADRITHKLKYSKIQFKKLIRSGIYSLTHVSSAGIMNHNDEENYVTTGTTYSDDMGNEAEQVSARIDGIDDTSDDQVDEEEGLKTLYEIHLDLELDEDEITDGELAPYIVTIDANEKAILSIYRNWAIGDKNYEAKKWFVDWKLLPWRGAYGIGFAELFDGTIASLTGILRALLDSGHTANFPTTVMLKGTGAAGQNVNVNPGEVTEIEGVSGVDQDVRKYIMPLQLGQPQPVLLDLMKNLETQFATLFSATENISDQMSQSRDMPVGTTLALLDESSKRMSAIHARLHKSNAVSLKILSRIFKENITSVITIEELGEAFIIKPTDFEYTNDIIPVSDPNIYSNTHRFAQLQAVAQLAQQMPNEYNLKELNRRLLQLIEVPDPEGLLNVIQDAGNINAVAENTAALNGIPIQVFSNQSHLQHFVCHLEFLESQVYGNAVFLASGGQILMQHMQKHITELYNQVFNEFIVQDGGDKLDLTSNAAEVDELLAKYNPMVLNVISKMLQPYEARLMKIMEAVKKAQPPQQQDPKLQETQMKIQAEQQLEQMRIEAQQIQTQAEMKMKTDEMQMKNQIEQIVMQNQSQNDQAELEMSRIKSETDKEIARQKAATEGAAMELDMIKVGADIYEKDMEVQRDLVLNEHTQTMDKVKHEFEVMSKGADIQLEHVKIKEAKKNIVKTEQQ